MIFGLLIDKKVFHSRVADSEISIVDITADTRFWVTETFLPKM